MNARVQHSKVNNAYIKCSMDSYKCQVKSHLQDINACVSLNTLIFNTIVWKYFVAKNFLWVMKPTKIYCMKNFYMNYLNKVHNKVFIYTYMHVQISKGRMNLKDLLFTSIASAITVAERLLEEMKLDPHHDHLLKGALDL